MYNRRCSGCQQEHDQPSRVDRARVCSSGRPVLQGVETQLGCLSERAEERLGKEMETLMS